MPQFGKIYVTFARFEYLSPYIRGRALELFLLCSIFFLFATRYIIFFYDFKFYTSEFWYLHSMVLLTFLVDVEIYPIVWHNKRKLLDKAELQRLSLKQFLSYERYGASTREDGLCGYHGCTGEKKIHAHSLSHNHIF